MRAGRFGDAERGRCGGLTKGAAVLRLGDDFIELCLVDFLTSTHLSRSGLPG